MSDLSFFIPGRIEILGKHTDYCGGRSITCAIDRGFRMEASFNNSDFINLISLDTKEKAAFSLNGEIISNDGRWQLYPQTVIERIIANFPQKKLIGCDISFASDLPQAAGLSSSSAFMIGIFLAISRSNKLEESEEYKANINSLEDLAAYLGAIENGSDFKALKGNRGVGTFGGSQDHAAILGGKEGMLTELSFLPLKFIGDISLPENFVFAIGVSGVTAEKSKDAKEKYNRLPLLAAEISAQFDETLNLAQLIEKYKFSHLLQKLEETHLRDRLSHFYFENFLIIREASKHLKLGQFWKARGYIDNSQRIAESFLGNQVPETVFLQRSAMELMAVASSAFGAGFGGSVYALVKKERAENFISDWQKGYQEKFPHLKPEFFLTKPSGAKI